MTSADAVVGRRRRIAGWAALTAALAVVGIAAAAIGGIAQLPARGLLEPDAAGPDGARALVRILERQGVSVETVRTREEARDALADGPATLAWADTAPLSDETIGDLATSADDVVLLQPRTRDLRLLLPGSAPAGFAADQAAAACDVPEAVRAGALTPGALFTAGDGIAACYPVGGAFGLLVDDRDGRRIVAVDATALFTNETLAREGNASLGLQLLGRTGRVVWYLPGDSDFAGEAPTLGELTPPWVTPALTLLIVAAAAAAVWRGRRFGPPVAERLPVTVRASETTEGRARLYARAGDPTHAADQLRVAVLRRCAHRLGLGPATAAEISDAVAVRLGVDRAVLRELLIDAVVRDDRQLVDVADRLRDLERRVARSVRPERKTT